VAADNLQTVIVSKETAKTRKAAERVAWEFANRITTSRETATSFRFRQRPPEDFRKGSFRTKKIDGGVSLVYGVLKASAKKKRNPDTYTDEVRFMYGMERKARGAEDGYDLARLAREVEAMDLASVNVRRSVLNTLMARAKGLRLKPTGYKQRDEEDRDRYFKMLLEHPTHPQGELFSNPGKPIRLKNPRTMPDPGPMSWLGTTLEWKWKGGKWENGKEDWLFLWSPKYKAVVAVKCPKKMDKLDKVSRRGGAAKTFERFMSRDPKATYDAEIPACKLVKLGKAEHIVYRSDKWKHGKKTEDYIHEFGKGVEIYCGPSKKDPEVFICFGGKLTATERGLVF
jgi:hypothetical protein